jgi:hypothetical protein
MARGWESKSVEEQIESAEYRRTKIRPILKTADQIRREKERDSIELTRTRVMRDLAEATHPRHRELLQAALQHLNEQIAALAEAIEPV